MTILIVMINILILYCFATLKGFELEPLDLVVVSILLVLVIVVAIRVFFEKYLVGKLIKIYRAIYGPKAARNTTEMEKSGLDLSFEKIDAEVGGWVAKREEEISVLKNLENYRRDYLGNISHELKTPIFSIEGFIHTLIEGGIYDENINIKYLKRANKNVERLKNIVEDLEMINTLESKKEPLEISKFDVVQLAEEIVSEVSIQAEPRSIKISVNGNNTPISVKADREKIRQVFNNLIVNAIKYGKDDGKVKISFEDMQNLVLVEVQDNGIGFSEQHQPHVFDRFYRVDSGRSRSEGGSGLGLSIVKHIIESHSQKISVTSAKNVGSTFTFTLEKA